MNNYQSNLYNISEKIYEKISYSNITFPEKTNGDMVIHLMIYLLLILL